MDKRFWGIIVIIILVFVGVLIFNKDENSKNTSEPTNHVMGSDQNKVVLLEYGDYQCPACGSYYPIVKQVVEKYKDQIQFQFRNLPLNQIHQNAYAAARAAEAADKQGKFWDMHDALYESQKSWSELGDAKPFFVTIAKQLGLNIDQFNKDYSSASVNDLINADIAAFDKTGQNKQTPSFFLNGNKLDTNPSVEDFSQKIDEVLSKK